MKKRNPHAGALRHYKPKRIEDKRESAKEMLDRVKMRYPETWEALRNADGDSCERWGQSA